MENKPELEKEAVDAFLKDYGEVVAKHKMDILARPVYVPTGDGASWVVQIHTNVVSTEGQPVKSPFMQP